MCLLLRRWLVALIVLVAVAAPGRLAQAQGQDDPRPVLAQVILQLQLGQPNPLWYGAELWNTIALQTGGTGRYPALVQLGAVRNVVLNSQVPLPSGVLYSMTAYHQNGVSNWILGWSTLTRRIEYGNFTVGGAAPSLPAGPQVAAPQAPPPVAAPPSGSRTIEEPDNAPPKAPPDTRESEACRKFPNMC